MADAHFILGNIINEFNNKVACNSIMEKVHFPQSLIDKLNSKLKEAGFASYWRSEVHFCPHLSYCDEIKEMNRIREFLALSILNYEVNEILDNKYNRYQIVNRINLFLSSGKKKYYFVLGYDGPYTCLILVYYDEIPINAFSSIALK